MAFSSCNHVNVMPLICRLAVVIVIVVNLAFCTTAYTSWVYIGKLHALSSFGSHMCSQISLAPAQRQLCERNPHMMESVRDGALQGMNECQHQFRNERWNCSTAGNWQPVFGKIMQIGSREAAFVHAITSAGVAYAVTQACSRGDLLDCSCDTKKTGTSREGFEWGGCSDDVKYGIEFAEEFIDARETDHDARANMNRHNNRVGRRAVKKFLKRQCKCHGPTQSCPTRTCWEELRDFRYAGDYLKEQYNRAVEVTARQDGSLLPANNKRLGKNDLVYLTSSPNYCRKNIATGSLGTSGRECNRTSDGPEGCDSLCCGRGYNTKRVTKEFQCKCRFHWCCEVRCEICSATMDVHTCKAERRRRRKGRKRGKGLKRRQKHSRGHKTQPVRTKRSLSSKNENTLAEEGLPERNVYSPDTSRIYIRSADEKFTDNQDYIFINKYAITWNSGQIRHRVVKNLNNKIANWWKNISSYLKMWVT